MSTTGHPPPDRMSGPEADSPMDVARYPCTETALIGWLDSSVC